MTRWKENKIVGITASVVFIVALLIIVLSLQPKKEYFLLKCKEGGEVFIKKISLPPKYPVICPNGHKAGYRAEALLLSNGKEVIVLEDKLPEDLRKYKLITDKKIKELLRR